MSRIITVILLLLSITACQQPTYVILMGGQSNMVGLGKVEEVDSIRYDNIEYHDFGLRSNLGRPDGLFGPEIGLSEVVGEAYPKRKFLLIKSAIGGASLLDWAPDYDPAAAEITGNARFGNMYDSLLTRVQKLTENRETRLMGLLWMQGERDARIPEAGKDYFVNFRNLIETLRRDLDAPDLPVLYGKVNPPADRYPALEAVNAAQDRIAREVPNTYLIETGDLEKWSDSLHYSTLGQVVLGRRFGEKLVEVGGGAQVR